MTSSADVSRLIGDIYDAALDESRWQATLGNVVQAMDARAGHLLIAGTGRLPQNLVSVNFDPDETLKYNAYYCRLDPVAPLLVTTPVGAIVTCREEVPVHARESEFYRDWASPNEVGDGIFVNIENDERSLCALVIARPWLSQPIATPRTLHMLDLLVPHFQRAMATRRALAPWAHDGLSHPVLENIHHGCVLLAADSTVLFANSIARQLTLAVDGLALSGRGLTAHRARDDATLQRLIKAARPGRNGLPRSGGRAAIARSGGAQPLMVQTVPLTSHWLGGTFPGSTLVLIIDAERMARASRRALQELYGLTAAEAALAVRIPGSRSLQSLADELGLSLSTVRTHLQRAFEKTGTHRQAELVQLLSDLNAIGVGTAIPGRPD
jgi:DNA-binding CsgD family transcriptional regulator